MTWNELSTKSAELFNQLHSIHVDFYHLWKDNVLFTWRWWIALSLIIIPWTVWVIVRKKESTDRLLYAGFFVMLSSAFLDVIGVASNLWSYPVNLVPLMPEFLPFDISAFPVTIMITIQIFPRVRPIIKAIVSSMFGAFVFQPMMSAVGLYDQMHWKHYYSFPILVAIYMVAHCLYNKNRFEK